MASNSGQPVRPRYGRVPGFGKRPTIEPGACPMCGAKPPCELPITAAEVKQQKGRYCRSMACSFSDVPHLWHPDTCPKER